MKGAYAPSCIIYDFCKQRLKQDADLTQRSSPLEILHLCQRPDAPQGSTRPLFVTGRPISCDSACPPNAFNSVAIMYVRTAGASPVV